MSHRASKPTNSDINALVLEMRQAGTDSTYEIVRAAFSRWATAAAAAAVAPVASVYTMEALVPGGREVSHVTLHKPLPAGTKLYAAPAAVAVPDERASTKRMNDLYVALEVCSAELFAQCAHQGRAMKYVEQARKALAAEQCARAALAATPPAQAQDVQRDDTALLDAMTANRIAVVPEFEGPWDAEIYREEGEPVARGSGDTPREAIRAAIAASAAQKGREA